VTSSALHDLPAAGAAPCTTRARSTGRQ